MHVCEKGILRRSWWWRWWDGYRTSFFIHSFMCI